MAIANLLIEYSTNSGISWSPIVSGYQVTAGSGIYEWVVPEEDTDEAMVRITDLYTDTLLDISDPFSITQYDSVSTLIVNKSDSSKLTNLKTWALSVSWCSRAIIETFETEEFLDKEGLTIEPANVLVIDEYNRATVPDNAAANTIYELYSKVITFDTDEVNEDANANIDSVLWSPQISASRLGSGHIKVEFNTTVDEDADNWFVVYDTSKTGSTSNPIYPNGFLDYSRTEISANDTDPYGTTCYATNAVQIKLSITTDNNGNGGYIDYYAFLADPNLTTY